MDSVFFIFFIPMHMLPSSQVGVTTWVSTPFLFTGSTPGVKTTFTLNLPDMYKEEHLG